MNNNVENLENNQPLQTDITPPAPDMVAVPVAPDQPAPSRGLVKVPTTRWDSVFAALFLIVSILWADFALFGGFDLGHSITAGALGVLMLVYPTRQHRLSVFGTLYATCSLAITVSFFMYTSSFAKFMLFLWAVFLMSLAIINNTRIARRGFKQLGDAIRQIFATPFQRVGNTFASLFQSKDSDSKKKASGALIGIACALPGLFIIIPILCASDAAFEAVIESIFADGLSRIIFSIILGVTLFGLAFATVFAATKGIVRIEDENAEKKPEQPKKGISATPIIAFLSMFAVVYVVYLFSQLAYFFNVFSGLLPDDFTAAQYARRGFFEMTVICAINVVMIALVLLLCKKDEKGNRPLAVRLLSLFVCLFSLVIVATVIGKLVLYMGDYGLSQLRVYTTLFCICAAIVIICVAVRLFVRRFAYFRVAAATLALLSVGVAFADVDTTVARYNTEAYMSGVLQEIDIYYLSTLDSASVPYLVKLMDCEDQTVAQSAATTLFRKAMLYGNVDKDSLSFESQNGVYSAPVESGNYYFSAYAQKDFREYNMEYDRAQRLIVENWDKIVSLNTDFDYYYY